MGFLQRKKLFLSFFLFIISVNGYSQDTIITKSGDTLLAKIIEINVDTLKYKRFDNPDGPVFMELTFGLERIIYESGLKQTLASETSMLNAYKKGEGDAYLYYRKYSGAGTATLIMTFFPFPFVGGLVTAIGTSTSGVQYKNLDFPNETLMKNKDYAEGYKRQAKKKKSNKVWTNFGIGAGILIGLIAISYAH